ncbi:MAG: hypothetical protein VX929_06990 [Pseudomonadota bacterium]|nr:hypothetical protein [Pseudomonadota bacterium]
MPISALKSWLDDGGSRLLWVEFEAYARRVFANSPDDWYADASRFASSLIQAQDAIPTQCLSIDLCAPLLSALGERDGAPHAEELVQLFGGDAHIEFVNDVLDALVHRFAGHVDLIVVLHAPADLLDAGAGTAALEFDELDDVASAMSNCLRPLADRPLTGVLLEKRGQAALSAEEIDAYEPIISAARHYDWVTAMSLPDRSGGTVPTVDLDLDLILFPQLALDAIAAEAEAPRLGGGLTDSFWGGAAIDAGASAGRLLYGSIPHSAHPETVLSVLRDLG